MTAPLGPRFGAVYVQKNPQAAYCADLYNPKISLTSPPEQAVTRAVRITPNNGVPLDTLLFFTGRDAQALQNPNGSVLGREALAQKKGWELSDKLTITERSNSKKGSVIRGARAALAESFNVPSANVQIRPPKE